MKKRAALALLALVACIPVDDFGAYWYKGYVDPGLIGSWQAETGPDRQQVMLSDSGGSYRIDSLDPVEHGKSDYTPVVARTLKVGRYTFLITGPKKGDLIRYTLADGKLVTYQLDGKAFKQWLEEKYPQAGNIDFGACDKDCNAHIALFDDGVFTALMNVPDSQAFWSEASRYHRLPLV